MAESDMIYLILTLFSISYIAEAAIWSKVDKITDRIQTLEGRIGRIEMKCKITNGES